MQINEQKYQFIRDGIPVTRIKPDGTSEEIKAVVIDFENIDNNDFLCVRELWIYGALYRRRADIVGFVNGIPLLFVELKNHNVEVENAFNEKKGFYAKVNLKQKKAEVYTKDLITVQEIRDMVRRSGYDPGTCKKIESL